ncbi:MULTISPECIES: 3-keto-5-aminohexanoate cleavage protein [Rhizobium]|uniref:3-keto-5-aminohexanoate cleavage protein n=1 Tax=Rhizobium TaxID=379 RepID=UPI003CC9C0E5
MPRFSHWRVRAFGRSEAACATTGALLGGYVRVGFENNPYGADGVWRHQTRIWCVTSSSRFDIWG